MNKECSDRIHFEGLVVVRRGPGCRDPCDSRAGSRRGHGTGVGPDRSGAVDRVSPGTYHRGVKGESRSSTLGPLGPQRHLFTIDPEVAYFNAAYMAPRLRAVQEAGERALVATSRPWDLVASDFFSMSERCRTLFARLINAEPDDVALVPSVSYGIGVAASNLPCARGQSILVLEEQFPSNYYPWQALARRQGAEIHVVPRPRDRDWTSAILAALATLGDQLAIVALPNCHWTDGSLIDLVQVGTETRRIGARLALDVTQSLGMFPLDVTEIQPDFLCCAGYKWLLGPYSVGFLYASKEHHDGVPLEYNWITRENSEDFAGLVRYRDGYQSGARRFDMGENSNFLLLPMVIAALEQILDWTPARTAEALSRVTGRIAGEAAELGLAVAPRSLRVGHLLGLEFPDGVPSSLAETLRRAKIHVSVRGSAIRIAPHLCTTDEDVDRLMRALQE